MTSKNLKMLRRLVETAPDAIADDAVVIVRDVMIRKNHVVITAEDIVRQELWHVEGRVDGRLHDVGVGDSDAGIQEIADRMLVEIDREYH